MSSKQQKVADIVSDNNKEIYIDAVCGSGKTEIVFESINLAILQGKRVGFVIPRREVVIEIYERLKIVYPTLNIISVYGGHNEFLDGDIICLTCHQCYRYKNKFGLTIIDEYDAFPLKGDNTLLNIVKKTSYEKIVYMSATFSKDFLSDKKSVSLDRRYHNYDLPVPNIVESNKLKCSYLLHEFLRQNKDSTNMIFFPTIRLAKIYYLYMSRSKFNVSLLTSKSKDRKDIFNKIKRKEIKNIFTTTILERGITVSNTNVMIMYGDHKNFDKETIIQICGRVGRKSTQTTGKILILCRKKTDSIEEAINTIISKNEG